MKNNRTAGHSYERAIRKWAIINGFPNCTTSRYSSKEKDDQKVDLCNTDPFNIQCKYTQTINFHTILQSMPKDNNYNLVFHKRKNQGTVVAMTLSDFEEILKLINT